MSAIDPHDDRSRGQKIVDNVAFTLVARGSMVLLPFVLGWWVNDLKGELTGIKNDIASVRNGVAIVQTSDAVQNERIINLQLRLDSTARKIERIEQKVFP